MKALVLPLLLFSLTGCGAFADAASADGGAPDAGLTLKVRPQFIKPGQSNYFELTFTQDLPWQEGECKANYVTALDLGGKDIEYTTEDYPGGRMVNATFHAKSNAQLGERMITAEVACEKTGEPQQTHLERGRLYVFEPDRADGGSR